MKKMSLILLVVAILISSVSVAAFAQPPTGGPAEGPPRMSDDGPRHPGGGDSWRQPADAPGEAPGSGHDQPNQDQHHQPAPRGPEPSDRHHDNNDVVAAFLILAGLISLAD